MTLLHWRAPGCGGTYITNALHNELGTRLDWQKDQFVQISLNQKLGKTWAVAMHVSLAGRKDLKGEIYRQLRAAIRNGQLRPGEHLSPSRELAQALAVSRSTVVAAYERLAAEGFVTSRSGGGTFVGGEFVRANRGAKPRSEGALRPRPIWESIGLPTVFDSAARFDFRTGLPDAALFPHRT
jgi:GntR family transcriptional regulator/MocR family aminotransferase